METGSIRKSDLEGKYVFWDIDGTLAPYRFNDHVSDPDGTNNGMSLKDKHFPIIRQQDRILTFENISKADSIVEYCAGHRIDLKDVVYVDDVLAFLREAERKGIKSYHISSFLDWDYSDDYFSLKDTDLYPLESTDVFFDIHNG